MSALNAAAKAELRAAGISQAAWARARGYEPGRWGGDACGCPDDRCKDGYHHYPDEDCGCLAALLAEHSRTGICTLAPSRPHADAGICRACLEHGLFAPVLADAGALARYDGQERQS